MSKAGIVLVAILVIVLIAISSATFAFYSASRDEFTFYVGSASGQSVALTIDSSSTGLRPATTTAGIKSYTKSTTDSRYQRAIYVIRYENGASDPVNVKFYITGVEYTTANGGSFTASDLVYIKSIIDFGFVTNVANNVDHADDAAGLKWVKEYDENNANATMSNQITVSGGAVGYLYCYIRFDVTQELVPPAFDGMKISFKIASSITDSQS